MTEEIPGVLLAGGLSRRMGGGDKCLRALGGRPLLSTVIERARPQVSALAINANGDPSRFIEFGLPVLPDVVADNAGPLAGVLTGMLWARDLAHSAGWIATFATDAPFFPTDFVIRLRMAAEAADTPLACAVSNGRRHPVFGLWRTKLADDLQTALTEEGIRKVEAWTTRHGVVHVEFATDPVDPFFNVNRPEDLAEAERVIALST